jgi:exodeoxyribonuclease VII large subunit
VTATLRTVSDLTALVRDALAVRPELEDVLVEGEVSNLTAHVSGHLYFTLKDARAQVSCVCFRANAMQIPFRPTNGMTVVAHGSVQVYEQQGRYQLYIDRLEPSGVGALALGIEQLKQRLSAEGLFDERRKRRLPLLPRRVVVVTSRSGAALRDVCTVIARRAPCIGVVLSPATVQGDGAVETLVRALARADQVRDADVILLVRGGGSLEDLLAFNSEALARAIRGTRLPVVTGVGHETDTTVADLAADRRGATPSAAAELVAPNIAGLRDDVVARHARLGVAIAGLVAVRRDRIKISSLRLRAALMQEAALKRRALDQQTSRFAVAHPSRRVEIERLRLTRSRELLDEAAERVTVARRASLTTRTARLAALSPRRTLERGYSITSDANGRVLTDASTVPVGARLRTVLRHGSLESTVDGIESDPPAEGERMYDAISEADDQ